MSIFDDIDATWAPARYQACGPIVLRVGEGGGKRVSAATSQITPDISEIEHAEEAMRDLDQAPLFMIRGTQTDFDKLLEMRGYDLLDPVVVLQAPVDPIAADGPDPVSAFPIWPPLAIMRELWAAAGIGPERLAVMERSADPKTSILGRAKDRAAGCGFVSISNGIAILHALEVTPEFRRAGTARNMVRAAAVWARDHGATQFAALTLQSNAPAIAVFSSLGMVPVEHYHYRHLPETKGTS